jgi:protein-tyrosine kinase
VLRELAQEYDTILLDTPAAALYADGQTVSAGAGAALLIARNNMSRMSRVRSVANTAVSGGVTLVGTVLNDF